MDAHKRIRLRRALPGVVAGLVLACILMFVFYSISPDQRSERAIRNVIKAYDFDMIEERRSGRTTAREEALIDVYDAPQLKLKEIDQLGATLFNSVGYDHIEVEGDTSYYDNEPRTYIFSASGMRVAEVRLMPIYRVGSGELVTRLIIRRHKNVDRNLWDVIFS